MFQDLTEFQSLYAAFRRARRGKAGTPEESAFYFDQESELFRLSDELRQRRYVPRPYRYFQIRAPKPRTISVAAFRDRVVHHALVDALQTRFEPAMYRHSYACRTDKGTHRAIEWIQHYARRFSRFLKVDVRKFFDHVSHPVLLDLIGRKVSCQDTQWLCATILEHARVPSAPTGSRRGIPIGNLTSQFWGNVYLDPVDQHLVQTRPGRIHVRYMDDLILFGHRASELRQAERDLKRFLTDRLMLELKNEVTVRAPVTEGIAFLGMRVFPNTVRLDRGARRRYTRKCRGALRAHARGDLSEDALAAALSSLTGFVESADTLTFRRKLWARCSAS